MRVRILVAMLILSAGALAQLTDEQLARVDRLQHQLIAPCCWQDVVANHRSEVALQMQGEIRQMVGEGKTDREILDRYKAEYGLRVLVEPEGGLFWVMNIVPVVVVLLGLAAAVLILRKWLKPLPAEPSEQGT